MKRLALVLICLLTLTGCWTPGYLKPFSPEPTPTSQKVVLFGDSLSWANAALVIDQFSHNPSVAFSHNSFGATSVHHWLDEMALVPDGSTVIVSLGTNDTGNFQNDYDLWKILQALNTLHDAGADCIVWLTLNTETADRFGEVQRKTDIYEYNEMLRYLDGDPNFPQLVIQEWQQISLGHAEWLDLPDFVHYNDAGSTAYADAQVDSINRCGGN